MTPTELAYTPAHELAQLIRTKALSPVEVTRATLARAEASQPVLNAFVTIAADQAMDAARAAEDQVMRGDTLGPLHGVPMTVKDLVNTKGVRTTFCSYIYEHNVPREDAIAVARLKTAGAILIGKTTSPEFGHKPLTEAPLFGRTRNAWSAERTSGGSSGGAGVAAAAGIAPLAISTDGGGSTRIPAAVNGVVGFKKSLGLVPHESTPDAFGNVSYIDPTTRTVRDCALMLEAMAGPDPSDPHSLFMPSTGFVAAVEGARDLAGVRMAWRPRMGNTAVDTEVEALCRSAFDAFAAFGAQPSEMADDFEPAEPIFQVLWSALLNARFRQFVPEFGPRMSETLLRQMDQGANATGEEVVKAIFARTQIFRQIQSWFTDVDIIVTPTITRTALPIDHDFFGPITINGKPAGTVRQSWYPYTHPMNLSGNPAITLPAGFHSDGLPIAIQLIGRRGEDALVLKAAALFEQARPWAQHRPALPELDGRG
ncbi:MAG: amidase [Hyphomicrobiaceae bacterium]|nr:amidase [Hyphomicrobiaceae bacterium]